MRPTLRVLLVGLSIAAATATSGCLYAAAMPVDDETVVITKYNSYMFGAFRSDQICEVPETGEPVCTEADAE